MAACHSRGGEWPPRPIAVMRSRGGSISPVIPSMLPARTGRPARPTSSTGPARPQPPAREWAAGHQTREDGHVTPSPAARLRRPRLDRRGIVTAPLRAAGLLGSMPPSPRHDPHTTRVRRTGSGSSHRRTGAACHRRTPRSRARPLQPRQVRAALRGRFPFAGEVCNSRTPVVGTLDKAPHQTHQVCVTPFRAPTRWRSSMPRVERPWKRSARWMESADLGCNRRRPLGTPPSRRPTCGAAVAHPGSRLQVPRRSASRTATTAPSLRPARHPSPVAQRRSQDRAAWGHLDGGNASAEKHHEPITVLAAKNTTIIGEGRDGVFDDLRLNRVRLCVGDIHSVAADQPDP